MSEFKAGDIVDIVIKGARVSSSTPTTIVVGVAETEMSLPLLVAHVERVAPPEWPPRVGDLWRDCGSHLWFAIDATDPDFHEDQRVALMSTFGGRQPDPNDLIDELGPWTLVRREEQDGGEDR